jgi:hypothetical protein
VLKFKKKIRRQKLNNFDSVRLAKRFLLLLESSLLGIAVDPWPATTTELCNTLYPWENCNVKILVTFLAYRKFIPVTEIRKGY